MPPAYTAARLLATHHLLAAVAVAIKGCHPLRTVVQWRQQTTIPSAYAGGRVRRFPFVTDQSVEGEAAALLTIVVATPGTSR